MKINKFQDTLSSVNIGQREKYFNREKQLPAVFYVFYFFFLGGGSRVKGVGV